MARRILLVDDEPEMLTLLELTLTIAGYDVAKTERGEQAARLITEFDPHVIILDIMMPGMSGHEVLRQSKQQFPNPPEVVILSARTGIDDISEGKKAGAFTYLFKPVTRSKLLQAVEAALEARFKREHQGK
jgi:two-component system OmpR family response regulator